jgi:hypothetical protein
MSYKTASCLLKGNPRVKINLHKLSKKGNIDRTLRLKKSLISFYGDIKCNMGLGQNPQWGDIYQMFRGEVLSRILLYN